MLSTSEPWYCLIRATYLKSLTRPSSDGMEPSVVTLLIISLAIISMALACFVLFRFVSFRVELWAEVCLELLEREAQSSNAKVA